MSASTKALELAANLAANLAQRLPSFLITQSTNSDGEATILIGAAAAGSEGARIRVQSAENPLGKDVLGLTANVYSPTIVKVGFEANPAGGAGADVNTLATMAPILGECFATGARVEVYASSNTDNPDDADLDDATLLKYVWNPSPLFGITANQ